jgi:ABC-type branched-subunit amino acid transport system ATPase component
MRYADGRTGRVVLEGPHRALMADDRVRRAYLGM